MSIKSTIDADFSTRQTDVFNALIWRNRVIGILRLAVPGIGLIFAGFLIFQIILSSIATEYGISGLKIERDQVIIEQPSYGGVMRDGTAYQILADVARVRISNPDIIDLAGANITIEQKDGYQIIADASGALLDIGNQNVVIPGLLQTLDTQNVRGQLNDTIIDWPAQTLTSKGPVRLEFDDGSVIRAQSLKYNAASGEWDFSGVIYNVPGDGGI
ncbi:MAG: hypothetical protein L3J21_12130 [Devosiaceae bacterium]|nr:hypothetical protein [Devosiaceae bacterium]